jgi:hypothetical protein
MTQPRANAGLESSGTHQRRPLRTVRAATAAVTREDRNVGELVTEHFVQELWVQRQKASIQVHKSPARHTASEGDPQASAEPNVDPTFKLRNVPESRPGPNAAGQ